MGKSSVDGIVVPESDTCQYKALTLENGMQVLLVSDPETDKASAAMNVDVGYFSDPEDLPGLAHFLEHMLFFASEKFPKEDAYSKFLQEHGGRSNAYTSMEQTNYQLDVGWDHLDEALDRFAQFFISPLLSADATGREVNAVHSEHVKNLTSDAWRVNQLQKSLVASDHPYHKFGTGSKDTLNDAPAAKGVDPREELIKFYNNQYSADRMHLVVYGKDSVEKLEQMVTQEGRFAQVQNKSLPPLRFPGEPCKEGSSQVVVKLVPVTEGHSVELVWSVPPDLPLHPSAPSRYLSHLLGHEGHGSLFALLKRKGWASSLMAGDSASSWHFSFFTLSIELTDAGQEHLEEVLELSYQYIGLLKGPGGVDEKIFDEMRDIQSTKFNFRDKQQPFNYTRTLSSNMQWYPKEDWVVGSSMPRGFDKEGISSIIEALSPENLRVFWASKSFEKEAEGGTGSGSPWDAEKWYNTKYCSTPLDSNIFKRLVDAYNGQTSTPPPSDLFLPKPNPYVPTDFRLVSETSGKDATPVVLQETSLFRLWLKPDNVFGLPKACVFLDLCSPVAYSSIESALLTRLYSLLLLDYLNEIAYDAEIAGLSYNISPTTHGIQVTVAGYSHKLLMLASEIVDRISTFEVKEDRFEVVKAKAIKDFENFKYNQPYQQALYTCSVMVEDAKWHILDYLKVMPQLSPGDLANFVPQLLRRMFLECYVAGNLSPEDSKKFLAEVQQKLESSPLTSTKPCLPAEMPTRRFICLPPGSSVHHSMPAPNPDDENSALAFSMQVGLDGSVTGSMQWPLLGELLVQVLERDAFHQLRTVQQLGYIVFLMARSDGGLHTVTFIIQSNVKGPGAVEDIVEKFLADSDAKIKALSAEDFKTHVESLISLKKEKKKNLREDASTVWKEISDGTCAFDRVQREVNELENVSLSDLTKFFATQIATDSPRRQKYSVQVFSSKCGAEVADGPDSSAGSQEPQFVSEAAGAAIVGKVEDLYEFKRSVPLYPSVKGRLNRKRGATVEGAASEGRKVEGESSS